MAHNAGEVVVTIRADTKQLFANVNAVNAKLASMGARVNVVGRGLNTVGKQGKQSMKSIGKGAKDSSNTMRLLNTKFNQAYRTLFNIKTIALVAFGGLVKASGDAAGSMAQLEVSLDTMTDGFGKETVSVLSAWAKNVNVNTKDAIRMFTRLKATGLEPNIEDMNRLLDVTNAYGGGLPVFQRVVKLFGDIAAKGRLMGQEVKQATEIGIPIEQIMIDAGKMSESMRGNMAKASVSSRDAFDALFNHIDKKFGGLTKKMMGEWSGLLERFADIRWRVFAAIGKIAIVPIFKNWITQVESLFSVKNLDKTLNSLLSIAKVFGTIFSALLKTINFVTSSIVKLIDYITEIKGIKYIFEGIVEGFGVLIVPILLVAKGISWFIKVISKMNPEVLKVIGYIIALKVSFSLVLPMVLKLSSGIIGLTKSIVTIGVVATASKLAMWLPNLASFIGLLKMHPYIALFTAGVIALGGAFIYLRKNWGFGATDLEKLTNNLENLEKQLKKYRESPKIGELDIYSREDYESVFIPDTIKQIDELKEKIKELKKTTKNGILGVDENAVMKDIRQMFVEITEASKKILGEGIMASMKKKVGDTVDNFKAYNDFVKEMGNRWKTWGDLALDSIKEVGNMFADFLQTGKFDFKSFVNALISDILRLAVAQQLVAPIVGALQGVFSSWAGGAGGTLPQISTAPVTPVTVTDLPAIGGTTHSFAKGGMINEPVVGFGTNSGESYSFGEQGSEAVIPNGASTKGTTNVKVELVNKSGTPIKVTQPKTTFNVNETIISVVLDAIERNVSGTREIIRGVR